jgi:TPR repeat protein
VIYASGLGVPTDETQALVWFRRAAEQGNAKAQYNLGVMYAEGLGVGRDEAEALVWYRKAAAQGNVKAQHNLETILAARHDTPRGEAPVPFHGGETKTGAGTAARPMRLTRRPGG